MTTPREQVLEALVRQLLTALIAKSPALQRVHKDGREFARAQRLLKQIGENVFDPDGAFRAYVAARAEIDGPKYTLDDEPIIDLDGWLSDNDDFFLNAERQRIRAMAVGESVLVGGGAGATFTVKRVR